MTREEEEAEKAEKVEKRGKKLRSKTGAGVSDKVAGKRKAVMDDEESEEERGTEIQKARERCGSVARPHSDQIR